MVKSAEISAPWVAMVRRSFIGTDARPGPPNSRLWLVASPQALARYRNTSLPPMPAGSSPVSSYRMVGPTVYQVSPVHKIAITSAGPSPRAAVLYAPPAQVCESVQVSTWPGKASAFSAMT